MREVNSASDPTAAALRHWDAVAPAWDAYRDRLSDDVRTVPGDPFAPGGLFSLSTPERNHDLLRAGGFADATVEELTGVMRYDNLDDYWTFVIAVSGPLAELVGALDAGQVQDLRTKLGPSLAPYENDGALELPWTAMVTRAV